MKTDPKKPKAPSPRAIKAAIQAFGQVRPEEHDSFASFSAKVRAALDAQELPAEDESEARAHLVLLVERYRTVFDIASSFG